MKFVIHGRVTSKSGVKNIPCLLVSRMASIFGCVQSCGILSFLVWQVVGKSTIGQYFMVNQIKDPGLAGIVSF